MTKIPARLMASLLLVPATLCAFNVLAAPSKASAKKGRTRLAALPKSAALRKSTHKSSAKISTVNLPRYVSLATIKKLRRQNPIEPGAALQPMLGGQPISVPMRDLLTGPGLALPPLAPAKAKIQNRVNAQRSARAGRTTRATRELPRFAQAFPRPIAPASPASLRAARNNATPKWVRYPLEFQLAGIGLGTRAVDKDRFNRIDRYGLFALHGNPTAVVTSVGGDTGGGAAGGAAPGGAPAGGAAPAGGGRGGRGGLAGGPAGGAEGGDAGGAPAGGGGTNVTLPQTPPETAALFPQAQIGGGLPDWALAVTVKLDNNHVEWLYKRETYAMGFVVDRLGFVDAVVVAGLSSDITRTQLEDPVHTVKLGDDFRKVQFRYGYPDQITVLASDPVASANDTTGAPGGGGAAAGGGGLAAGGGGPTRGGLEGGDLGGAAADGGAAGGAAAGGGATNSAYRTYDLRYEQSYNVVFTIRNNRVVRIYIFGDPDFFNAQRRNQIRTKY